MVFNKLSKNPKSFPTKKRRNITPPKSLFQLFWNPDFTLDLAEVSEIVWQQVKTIT